MSGFSVSEFDFTVEAPRESASVELTWLAPDEAKTVACVLVRCAPEFSTFEVSTGSNAKNMDTFDQCVLSIDYYDARRRSTTVAKLVPVSIKKVDVLEQLAVGCWAYDDVKVIAATRLEPIDPARSFVSSLFANCTEEASNDKACTVATDKPFGICNDGICRARCVDDDDCAGLPLDPASATSDAALSDAALDEDASDAADAETIDASDAGDAADAADATDDSDAGEVPVVEPQDAAADAGTDLCRHTCDHSRGRVGFCKPKKN